MSSDIRRIVWNTRERALSTDLNDASALQHRALIEGLAAGEYGDTQQLGVMRGLTVSVPGGSLSVSVAAGLAMRLGSAPTTYDSAIEWVELRSAQSVDLSSYVDGANPRWVCIEIANTDAVETSSSRDVWNPATGTFSSSSLDKVRGSAPAITVTAGTAAATPQLPAGVAGRIPLAYVYIPAGAATLTAGDVVHCRPIMKAGGHRDTFRSSVRSVEGGGVSVASLGTTVALRQCTGVFDLHHVPFGVGVGSGSTTSLAVPAGGYDGGSVPATDAPVYFYAIPAPYPAGYDASLAPREFRPEASAATRFPALVTADLSGCLVVASTTAPNTGTLQGAPTAGNFSITAAPWGGSAVVARSRGVYLGAASWDLGTLQFQVQTDRGGGRVLLTGEKPSLDLRPGGTLLVAPLAVNLWGVAGTDAALLPATAHEVEANMRVQGAGTHQTFTYEFRDEVNNNTPSNTVIREETARFAPLPAQVETNVPLKLMLTATGEFTIQVLSATGSGGGGGAEFTALVIRPVAYFDSVLRRR